jgi:GDP/UDP-N,N'-diacetylbacillosamine 2-epimerase (hydrolysing)
MKKICFVTGSRAEYGLLRWLMQEILQYSDLKLQIVVTGMHLSPEYGLTYKDIEDDGFMIDYKVEMLMSSDTSVGLTKSVGLGIIGFADAFEVLKPNLVILLGDRFEIFAAATAAMVRGIPIGHIHGGEVTEGSFDEAFRHSITKMSNIHFVAAHEYRKRVIQLGEDPERVFLVGGLGADSINKLQLLGREDLENSLDFKFGKKNLLITFHPVTLEHSTAAPQMKELFFALDALKETNLFFTMPNADKNGKILSEMIKDYVSQRPHAKAFTSMGQLRYISTMAQVDAVVGNSSSGLIEAPSFKKATINIGDRQKGRLKAISVLDCEPNASSILDALNKIYSKEFQINLGITKNPYGDGGASEKILAVLRNYDLNSSIKKSFYDLQ